MTTLLSGASVSGSEQASFMDTHLPPAPSWCGTHRTRLSIAMKCATTAAVIDSSMGGSNLPALGHNLNSQDSDAVRMSGVS